MLQTPGKIVELADDWIIGSAGEPIHFSAVPLFAASVRKKRTGEITSAFCVR
jgi:hypothetical protein